MDKASCASTEAERADDKASGQLWQQPISGELAKMQVVDRGGIARCSPEQLWTAGCGAYTRKDWIALASLTFSRCIHDVGTTSGALPLQENLHYTADMEMQLGSYLELSY